MSTKELLIRHLDDLNETQQKSLLMFLLSMTGSTVTPETLAAMPEFADLMKGAEERKK